MYKSRQVHTQKRWMCSIHSSSDFKHTRNSTRGADKRHGTLTTLARSSLTQLDSQNGLTTPQHHVKDRTLKHNQAAVHYRRHLVRSSHETVNRTCTMSLTSNGYKMSTASHFKTAKQFAEFRHEMNHHSIPALSWQQASLSKGIF